jgi:hypothetical protein
MKPQPLYQAIARQLATIERCKSPSANDSQRSCIDMHEERLDAMLKPLPSGSGIDAGTKLLAHECKSNKLVFQADFHHMNDVGMYDGWTEHKVIVTPSLEWGAVIKITGRNRNDIKTYLHDVYHHALTQEIAA